MADQQQLQAWLTENAGELPGAAIGVYHEGAEYYAFHGVTSIDNPLDVDENTLFQYGSTHKTYTGTAIMRLVEQGKIDLAHHVRSYIPGLRLKDEHAAENVTVLQLLNHTAGWQGDAHEDFGDGDDALANYVEHMATLEQVTPLGASFSYNNASLNLAGRVIEKVTGKTYEQAIKELLYEPLGLEQTYFFPNEIMTYRFAAGHRQDPDDTIHARHKWAMSRCSAPAGGFGVSSNAADQIKWARFHLGDGTAPDGTRVLSKELLELMREPTFEIRGSALGDSVGISWFLEDTGGVTKVSHGGDTLGHHSSFVMVPERDFAVIALTNCDGLGSKVKGEAVKWVLEAFIGVIERDPEPVLLPESELAPYTGTFETIAAFADVTVEGGGLLLKVRVKPEMLKQLTEAGEPVPDQPPIPIGLLGGEGDQYIITDGAAKGMRGYFVRSEDGTIDAVHVGGRLAIRTKESVNA